VGGLLDRLIYLSKGLAFVLAFIGLKLIFEAMHHHGVPWAPEIPITLSLGVIVVTLAVTTVASLIGSRRLERRALAEAEAASASTEAEEVESTQR
jgi:tellurite resistance protein TerC